MNIASKNSVLSILEDAVGKFGYRVEINGKWGRIPAVWRGSKDYNVAVNLETGTARDFRDSVRIEFDDLMALLSHTPPEDVLRTRIVSESAEIKRKIGDARNLWDSGSDLTTKRRSTEVSLKYLEGRGLKHEHIARHLSRIRAVESNYGGATLMFPIFSPHKNTGRYGQYPLTGVQRIFLDKHGNKYGDEPKKMLGVHLYNDESGGFLLAGDRSRVSEPILATCEGPETGLAISAGTGMPVYILYDAGGLERVCIPYLSSIGVTQLLIAGDSDKMDKFGVRRGIQASENLARRVYEMDVPSKIALPPYELGMDDGLTADWLDVWNNAPEKMSPLMKAAQSWNPESEDPPRVTLSRRRKAAVV